MKAYDEKLVRMNLQTMFYLGFCITEAMPINHFKMQSYSHRTKDVRYDFVDTEIHMKSNGRRNSKSNDSNDFWSSRTDDDKELKAAEISKTPKQSKRKTTYAYAAVTMGVKHDDGVRRDRIRRITSRRTELRNKLKYCFELLFVCLFTLYFS